MLKRTGIAVEVKSGRQPVWAISEAAHLLRHARLALRFSEIIKNAKSQSRFPQLWGYL
jgi:hypothetical protein